MASVAQRGSALLVVLVALVAVGASLVRAHHAALETRRRAGAALAALRAREAAASGLVAALHGGALTGILAGGAEWRVTPDTTPVGAVIWWSQGRVLRPQAARLEVAGVMAPAETTAVDTLPARLVWRWGVMRR